MHNKCRVMNQKAFTLIELLVVVAIIGILAAVGVVAYGKYATSAKIAASKEQHYSMKKFIEASYGQCALGDNYVLMYESGTLIHFIYT